MRDVKRGEVYWCDMEQYSGSEQGGIRPVLIIQNDKGNGFSPCVIVCTLTKVKKVYPMHVRITPKSWLKQTSYAQLEQIFTIDKHRLRYKITELTQEEMDQIDRAITISLGLERSKNEGANSGA